MTSESFKRLDKEKQKRIIDAAVEEFADKGYEGANTNRIAKLADISVGSLFKYFSNKQSLFLYIVELGVEELESIVGEVLDQEEGFFETVEAIIRTTINITEEKDSLIKLYYEITSIGQSELSKEVATRLEGYTSRGYKKLVRRGIEQKEVRQNIDPAMGAFLLDHIFMAVEFSFSMPFYIERYHMYFDKGQDQEAFIQSMLTVIRNAFER